MTAPSVRARANSLARFNRVQQHLAAINRADLVALDWWVHAYPAAAAARNSGKESRDRLAHSQAWRRSLFAPANPGRCFALGGPPCGWVGPCKWKLDRTAVPRFRCSDRTALSYRALWQHLVDAGANPQAPGDLDETAQSIIDRTLMAPVWTAITRQERGRPRLPSSPDVELFQAMLVAADLKHLKLETSTLLSSMESACKAGRKTMAEALLEHSPGFEMSAYLIRQGLIQAAAHGQLDMLAHFWDRPDHAMLDDWPHGKEGWCLARLMDRFIFPQKAVIWLVDRVSDWNQVAEAFGVQNAASAQWTALDRLASWIPLEVQANWVHRFGNGLPATHARVLAHERDERAQGLGPATRRMRSRT